jgi:hypothetical protein
MKMVDKEWTCFFHWTQFLNIHIKWLIVLEFHDQHKALCYEYKKNTSLEEVDLDMLPFRLGDTYMELRAKAPSTSLTIGSNFGISRATMGKLDVGCKFYQTIVFKFKSPYVLLGF